MAINRVAVPRPNSFPLVAGMLPAQPLAALPQRNPVQTVGLYILLAYLFAVFSLLTEVSTQLFGFKPYVTLFTGPLAVLLALISGQILRALRTPTGILTAAFLAWILVATPFTSYKSGTLEELQGIFLRTYPIAFLCAALTATVADCKKILHALVTAGFVVFLVTAKFGRPDQDGRFSMSFGSLTNPNDLATHLMLIVPLSLGAAAMSNKKVVRALVYISVLIMLLFVLKTASRAALISLLATALVVIWTASPIQKILAVIGVAIALLVSAFALPEITWQRFATTVSDNEVGYGVGSREARKRMFLRSVWTAVTHPIVGVGPGVFIAYDAREATNQGHSASWVGTHNSYTQVASEAGIPALIFFVAAIASAIRACGRIRRASGGIPEFREIHLFATYLPIAWIALAVNIGFAHVAYRYYVPTLLGLTIAFTLAAESALKTNPTPAAVPGPLPLPGQNHTARPAWQTIVQ